MRAVTVHSLFPSQRIKASKNILCLQSSSKQHVFHRTQKISIRNFHSTNPRFENRNDSKITPSNDPVVNSRLFDNVVVIENQLSSLISEEVKQLKENFNQSVAQLKTQFLSPSFSFTTKDTRGILTVNTKGRLVEVEWDLTVVPKMEESDLSTELLSSSEDQKVTGEEDSEESLVQEGGVEGDLNEKVSTADVNFDVRIFHQSNSVCIRCTAGIDSRLYILSVSKSSSEDENIVVNDLSEELQQRLYDYMEELSISDLVACFIRQYNVLYRRNQQAESLNSLLPYFSKV